MVEYVDNYPLSVASDIKAFSTKLEVVFIYIRQPM